MIGASPACARLVTVAAVRSTGLSASPGIGASVAELRAASGIQLSPQRPPSAPPEHVQDGEPWWQRAARRHGLREP